MNTQYKKGVLELCVLSLLKKRDCYGYEISEYLAGHIDIADGTVYPCDFYVLDEYKLGDVRTDTFEAMLGSEAARRFEEPGSVVLDECLLCEYYFICRAGCRRDREDVDGEAVNYYCEGYKRFFAHALPRMKEIAQNIRDNQSIV